MKNSEVKIRGVILTHVFMVKRKMERQVIFERGKTAKKGKPSEGG